MTTDVRRQTRRKVTLELLGLVVPAVAAVLLSGELVVDWERRTSVLVGLLTAAVLVGSWLWHRSRHPADLSPPAPDDEDDREDDGGPWSPLDSLVAAALTVVVVVGGLALLCWLPLLVVLLFAVADSGSDLGDVLLAAGAALGVTVVLEVAVLGPLSRRWDLAHHDEPATSPA